MSFRPEDVRNIGIVAHINAGKTTLTERILFDSGTQSFMGEVDDGTAAMDWMPEEQKRGISITAAVTHVDWHGYRINLIDTPGHVDFCAEVERCLRVLDGVVVVLDAVRGVESQTEIIWKQVQAFGIPRLVFVNKMDRETADFEACVVSLEERLGCRTLPLILPLRESNLLRGLVDVMHDAVQGIVPGERARPKEGSNWQLSRQSIVEACADYDDGIMQDFVEGRDIAETRLVAALRRAVLACDLVPVLAGAALPNHGVDLLLDAVCRYLPSPLDRPLLTDRSGGAVLTVVADPDGPFCGLLFKVQLDVGQELYYVRVYRGTLRVGDMVGASGRLGTVQVNAIWAMHAMHRQQLPAAQAGDVVVLELSVTGDRLRTGDSLFDPGHPVMLAPLHFPPPVLTRSLEAAVHEDDPDLEAAARRLVWEDPTLALRRDPETGALQVSGMGELHLQVFGQRLEAALGRPLRLGAPAVLRRETLARPVEVQGECRRHQEGREHSTVVRLAVEPVPGCPGEVADVGLEPALAGQVQDLLTAQLRMGLRGTHPAHDLRVRVLDVEGARPGPDGEAMLGAALAIACRRAAAEAGVVTLEPAMAYDIQCPSETLAPVLADLKARGAVVQDVTAGIGVASIRGRVVLSRVLGYTTRLRSMTRGLGTVSLTPAGFEPIAEQR